MARLTGAAPVQGRNKSEGEATSQEDSAEARDFLELLVEQGWVELKKGKPSEALVSKIAEILGSRVYSRDDQVEQLQELLLDSSDVEELFAGEDELEGALAHFDRR